MPTVSQPRTRRIGQSAQAGVPVSDRKVNVQDRRSFSRRGKNLRRLLISAGRLSRI